MLHAVCPRVLSLSCMFVLYVLSLAYAGWYSVSLDQWTCYLVKNMLQPILILVRRMNGEITGTMYEGRVLVSCSLLSYLRMSTSLCAFSSQCSTIRATNLLVYP